MRRVRWALPALITVAANVFGVAAGLVTRQVVVGAAVAFIVCFAGIFLLAIRLQRQDKDTPRR